MSLEHRRRHARRVNRRKEVDLRLRALEPVAAELRHAVGYLRVALGLLLLEALHVRAEVPGPVAPLAPRRLLLHLLDLHALLREHVLKLLYARAQYAHLLLRRLVGARFCLDLLGRGLFRRGFRGPCGRGEAKTDGGPCEERDDDRREVSDFHVFTPTLPRRICARAFP